MYSFPNKIKINKNETIFLIVRILIALINRSLSQVKNWFIFLIRTKQKNMFLSFFKSYFPNSK